MSLPSWATLVRAANPGPMTLEGTNTYVLRCAGAAASVVVDPGPLLDEHLLRVAEHRPVATVLLTHTHPDHAAGAARFAELVGAPVRGAGDRSLVDDQILSAAGLTIRVVATPGHSSDSVCFLVGAAAESAVLTGDTVLGRGTTVVAHPDGNLVDYFASLRRLRALGDIPVLPGHGPALPSSRRVAQSYLDHRAERLDQVRAALAAGARTAGEVVRRVYADVDPVLWPAAELSVHAQLDFLAADQPPA